MGMSRITTLQMSNTMLDYIMGAESRYNELTKTASSGLKVDKPSDNPSATKSILNITAEIDKLKRYLDNMSNAESELNSVDSKLEALTDLIQTSSDYATQAANGTYNDEDLANIKSQIDQIIESVVDIANTKFNGKYVFSGAATLTETYTKNSSTGVISYNGTTSSEYERYANISDGVSVAINVRGSDLFGSYTPATTSPVAPATGSGLFYTLGTLSAALGSIPPDKATISTCIDNLGTDLDTVTKTRTELAAVSNRFEMTSDTIDNTLINLTNYKSNLQDADLTEVLTDLATAENALQATYSVTSQMLSQVTLLDYM